MNTSSQSNASLGFLHACATTKFVLEQAALVPLLWIEILVGTVAVVFNCGLIVSIWKAKTFHANLRSLLAYFSVCLAWFNFSRCYKAVIILFLVSDADPCRRLKTSYQCSVDEILVSIPSYLTPWSFFGLCLERLYATLRYKSYETSGTSLWIILASIVLVSVTPISSNVNTVLRSSTTQYSPLCESLLSKSGTIGALPLSVTSVVICLASALCCKFWNDYKMRMGGLNRAQQTLASRFQIAQNVQINRMLLPTMLLQTLCNAPHYILLALLLSDLDVHVETRSVLSHCNYIWRMAYALLHPLLAFHRIRALRQQLTLYLPCLQRKRPEAKTVNRVGAEAKLHFVILEAAWERAREAKKKHVARVSP